MSYEKACNLFGYSINNSITKNAAMATTRQSCFILKTPLRYKVAATVIIRESEK